MRTDELPTPRREAAAVRAERLAWLRALDRFFAVRVERYGIPQTKGDFVSMYAQELALAAAAREEKAG